jgi:methylthioribose-1-phosphate isomerase
MNLNIIPVKWTDEGVAMLDQRLLPTEEKWLILKSYDEVAAGIKDMVVRVHPRSACLRRMASRWERGSLSGRMSMTSKKSLNTSARCLARLVRPQ